MKSAEEIRQHAEEQKALAANILNRVFLNTPPGFENSAARDLVNCIVNAAMLEIAAVQREALQDGNGHE